MRTFGCVGLIWPKGELEPPASTPHTLYQPNPPKANGLSIICTTAVRPGRIKKLCCTCSAARTNVTEQTKKQDASMKKARRRENPPQSVQPSVRPSVWTRVSAGHGLKFGGCSWRMRAPIVRLDALTVKDYWGVRGVGGLWRLLSGFAISRIEVASISHETYD